MTYGQLLQIFFSVVTDPTTLNYQGNDYGTSYRSALFTMNAEQKKVAEAYIAQLDAAKVFPAKIVTEVTPYSNFYQAEDYHQDNAYTMKVNAGYLMHYDLPKIADMKAMYRQPLGRKAGAGVRLERLIRTTDRIEKGALSSAPFALALEQLFDIGRDALGSVSEPNRRTGWPSRPMRNLVKFHFTSLSPRNPGAAFFSH